MLYLTLGPSGAKAQHEEVGDAEDGTLLTYMESSHNGKLHECHLQIHISQ